MKKYKSKISWKLIAFLAVMFSFIGFEVVTNPINWLALMVLLLCLLFIIHLFTSISYTIIEDELKVKAGFLVNTKIPISSIHKIKETNNLISSPAASLDRLEIFYGKYESIIISPMDKNEFIQDLLKINPNIAMEYKI